MGRKRPVKGICFLVVFLVTRISVFADEIQSSSGSVLCFDFLFTDPTLIVSTPERLQFLLVPDLIDGRLAAPELLTTNIKIANRPPPQNCDRELDIVNLDHCRRAFSPAPRFNQLGFVPYFEIGRSTLAGHSIVIESKYQKCYLTKFNESNIGRYAKRISIDTTFGDLRVNGKLNGVDTVFRLSFDAATFLGISPACKSDLKVKLTDDGSTDCQSVLVNGVEVKDAIISLRDESSTLPVLGMDFIRRLSSTFSFRDVNSIDWEFNENDMLTSLPIYYRRQFEIKSEQTAFRVTQVSSSFALAGLKVDDRFLSHTLDSVTAYYFAEQLAKRIRFGDTVEIERNGDVKMIRFDSSKIAAPQHNGLSIEL